MTEFLSSPFDFAVIVEVFEPKRLVVLQHGRGQDVWSWGKLRKPRECSRCWKELAKGVGAFHPITNKEYRSNRICETCMDDIDRGGDRKR